MTEAPWGIRLRQYLDSLRHEWRRASAPPGLYEFVAREIRSAFDRGVAAGRGQNVDQITRENEQLKRDAFVQGELVQALRDEVNEWKAAEARARALLESEIPRGW